VPRPCAGRGCDDRQRRSAPAYWAPFVLVGEGGGSVVIRSIVGGAPTQDGSANRRPSGKDVGDWTADMWKKQPNSTPDS
jgi:hypothetical protein